MRTRLDLANSSYTPSFAYLSFLPTLTVPLFGGGGLASCFLASSPAGASAALAKQAAHAVDAAVTVARMTNFLRFISVSADRFSDDIRCAPMSKLLACT